MKTPVRVIHIAGIFLALSMLGCSDRGPIVSAEINQSASLAGEFAAALPANPLRWNVITSEINQRCCRTASNSAMSTLYGNELAVAYARANSQHDYPGGSVLSMVHWTQREDPSWFGAKIPGQVISVEFLTVRKGTDGKPSYLYEAYGGAPLKKLASPEGLTPNDRPAYLLSQRAAVMP